MPRQRGWLHAPARRAPAALHRPREGARRTSTGDGRARRRRATRPSPRTRARRAGMIRLLSWRRGAGPARRWRRASPHWRRCPGDRAPAAAPRPRSSGKAWTSRRCGSPCWLARSRALRARRADAGRAAARGDAGAGGGWSRATRRAVTASCGLAMRMPAGRPHRRAAISGRRARRHAGGHHLPVVTASLAMRSHVRTSCRYHADDLAGAAATGRARWQTRPDARQRRDRRRSRRAARLPLHLCWSGDWRRRGSPRALATRRGHRSSARCAAREICALVARGQGDRAGMGRSRGSCRRDRRRAGETSASPSASTALQRLAAALASTRAICRPPGTGWRRMTAGWRGAARCSASPRDRYSGRSIIGRRARCERAHEHAARALAHATAPRQPLALLAAHRLLGELGDRRRALR